MKIALEMWLESWKWRLSALNDVLPCVMCFFNEKRILWYFAVEEREGFSLAEENSTRNKFKKWMGFTGYFQVAEALKTPCLSSGREALNLCCHRQGKTLCGVLLNDFGDDVWNLVS